MRAEPTVDLRPTSAAQHDLLLLTRLATVSLSRIVGCVALITRTKSRRVVLLVSPRNFLTFSTMARAMDVMEQCIVSPLTAHAVHLTHV